MSLFVAYLKNIEVGTKTNGVSFSNQKLEFVGHILVLKRSTEFSDRYVLFNSKTLFHESWLDSITDINSRNFGILSFTNKRKQIYRIVRVVDGEFYDIKTNDKIRKNAKAFWAEREFVEGYTTNNHFDVNIERDFDTCVFCGKKFWMDQRDIMTRDTTVCCTSCFEKRFQRCDVCGEYFLGNEHNIFKRHNKKYTVCNNCFHMIKKCDGCGEVFVSGDGYAVEDKNYCQKCIKDEKFVTCSKCGNYFHKESKNVYKNKFGSYVCSVCKFISRVGGVGAESIKRYTYKPSPNFFGNSNIDNLYFGVELEVETQGMKEEIANYIQYVINEEEEFIYCKSDSSIGDGFEIVSHPFNFNWLKFEGGVNKIKQIMDLKSYRCCADSTNTCGMHVHLSKDAFDSFHLYKFLDFIYNNKEFCIKISERTDKSKIDRYMNFSPEYKLTKIAKDRSNPREPESRHKAVNLSEPNTVEVRIFHGTLMFESFMKNIEFCKSLFDFTQKESKHNISVDNYLGFIKEKAKTFKHLYTFLNGETK